MLHREVITTNSENQPVFMASNDKPGFVVLRWNNKLTYFSVPKAYELLIEIEHAIQKVERG